MPDVSHTLFIGGGLIDAYITLEDADHANVQSLNESLCAVLAGPANATTASDGSKVCTRDAAGKIVYHGAWCSTTNAPASASTCADAEKLTSSFAASSIQINN
jgi:hypothetical protein